MVFLAEMRGPFGFCRRVAVKRLQPPYARDPRCVSMLLDEARLCAFVRHPNVAQVLDLVAECGELWVVLEHVLGASLREISSLQPGPVAPPIACSIARDVLLGLHAAHEARGGAGERLCLVHRDVSPHNVLLGLDGIARVTDFGIAKAMWRAQSTVDGQLKGKLGYMAPEQLGAGPIDRRSDVFGAAIVLWELLAGERLFPSCEPTDVLSRSQRMIEPPSSRTAAISADLDRVVLRGLRADPSERFASAMAMVEALEQHGVFASRQQVADWLQSQVPELLAERERMLHRAARTAGNPAEAELPAVLSPSADEDTYVGRTDAERSKPARRALAARGLFGLAGAGLVLLGFGVRFLLVPTASATPTHDPPQSMVGGSAPGGPATSGPSGPTANGPTAERPLPSTGQGAGEHPAFEPTRASAQPDPSLRPSLPTAAAARSAPTSQAAPAATAGSPVRGRQGCETPFEIDGDGIKRFKEQCL